MRTNLFKYIFGVHLVILLGCVSDSNNKTLSIEADSNNSPKEELQSNQPADERMSWQKPDLVIEAMGNLEDKVVADLGAGIGYFSFKLLGQSKRVIAIDIDQEKVDILNGFKSSLRESLKSNFEVRLATETDPNLKEKEVDLIFIVNTIAYIQPRVNYLKNLRRYLKPGGQIFIVDFKTKKMPEYTNAPSYDERVYLHILEEQLSEAGYNNIITNDTKLEYQYIIRASI